MDWTRMFLDFFADIVWAVFALVFVLVFRAPITRLIDRVKRGKGWGLEFEAAELAKESREVADSLEEPSDDVTQLDETQPKFMNDASLRVVNAWKAAEVLAAELSEAEGIPSGGSSSVLSLITALHADKRVNENAVDVASRLRNVRNEIAHGLEVTDEALASVLVAINDLERTMRRATQVPGLAKVGGVVESTTESLRDAGLKPGASIRNAYGAGISIHGSADEAVLDGLVAKAKAQGVRLQFTLLDDDGDEPLVKRDGNLG